MQNKKIKEKSNQTNIKRYGYENPMKNKSISSKMAETKLNYTDEEKEKIKEKKLNAWNIKTDNDKEKIIEKKLKIWNNKKDEEKEKIMNKRKKTKGDRFKKKAEFLDLERSIFCVQTWKGKLIGEMCRSLLSILVLSLLTGMVGCASAQLYQGEKLSPEQVATIKARHVMITEVDGEWLGMGNFYSKYELKPGYHEIGFGIDKGYSSSFTKVVVGVNTEAGKEYVIAGHVVGTKWTYTVVDAATGHEVGKEVGAKFNW